MATAATAVLRIDYSIKYSECLKSERAVWKTKQEKVPISDRKKGKSPVSEQKCLVFRHFASLDHFRYKKKIYIKRSSLVSQLGCSDFRQCRDPNKMVRISDNV